MPQRGERVRRVVRRAQVYSFLEVRDRPFQVSFIRVELREGRLGGRRPGEEELEQEDVGPPVGSSSTSSIHETSAARPGEVTR